jgi:hypothetical protein
MLLLYKNVHSDHHPSTSTIMLLSCLRAIKPTLELEQKNLQMLLFK